jgi:hypothetical protein
MYVAVGDGGVAYSSTDGNIWSTLTNGSPANLNAVIYDSLHAKYLSAGATGTVVALTPATSSTLWATQTSNTPNILYALANNGSGFTVATGATGTIIASSDGVTWIDHTATSGTAKNLNGVAYGNGIFVAVGATGTVVHSTDGATWVGATTPGTANTLTSVTYSADAGVFVAVGVSGTVITSPDGITWTPKLTATTTIPGTTQLNSVTYSAGRRFVAVANDGSIYYSEYASAGAAWTQAVPASVTLTPLNAVTTGGLYDYSAVGAVGLNLYSD